MATYRLIYADDEFGVARRIEFDAADPFMALTIAQNESEGRIAELWEGERKLCTLRRTGPNGSIWEVGPCTGIQPTDDRAPALAEGHCLIE